MREGKVAIIRRSATLREPAMLSILSAVELEGGVSVAAEGARERRVKLDAIYDAMEIRSFEWPDVLAYRKIVTRLGFSRPKIIDRMIAAQAITAGARLATLNPRDFRGIAELQIDDWSIAQS